MKIRQGFVSNSSSSSFLILMTDKAFNGLELNEFEKLVLADEVFELGGVKLHTFSFVSGEYGDYVDAAEARRLYLKAYPEEDDIKPGDAKEVYRETQYEILKKCRDLPRKFPGETFIDTKEW